MLVGIDATPFFGTGAGIARYLAEMLQAMARLSPDDTFLLYSPRPIEAIPAGSWRIRTPKNRRTNVPGRWLRHDLPRLLAEDRVDVFWGQSTVVPLRRLHPCRTVLTVHDVTGLVCPRTMEFGMRLYWRVNFRAAVQAADVVVTDSWATCRLLHQQLLVPKERIAVVYPGLPSTITLASTFSPESSGSTRLSLPERFVLSVGTLEPRKDYLTLLMALRLMRKPPLVAIIGAVGWRSRDIVRAVREAESDGLVRYLGRVDDAEMSVLYHLARAVVYPSFYEGFGFPVLEAMACGCPVLCSWTSSLPEVGGTAARYFRPRDTEHLAERLQTLLSDEHQLELMREAGKAQSKRFSFDQAARQMHAVIRGRPCPSPERRSP